MVTRSQAGRVAVLTVVGDFILDDACQELRRAIAAAVSDGFRCLLVDVSGAKRWSSGASGVLVAAHVDHGRRGALFKVCGGKRPKAAWGFILVSPHALFGETECMTVAEALATFNASDCGPG